MTPAGTSPRLAVRAVILDAGRLLLVNAYPGEQSDLWCVPGGGAERGLGLEENLRREVREETGLEIAPGRLLGISEFHDPAAGFHQVDLIFAARRVFIFGQGHAQSVAAFLQRRLDRFGMTTIALTGRGRDIAELIVGMERGDLVLALAFRKQPKSYPPLLHHARGVGADSILISDLAGPMMEPRADHLLAAPRGRSGSEFQTPTIPFAIVNAILMTMAGRHEAPIIGKLEKLSELFADFD